MTTNSIMQNRYNKKEIAQSFGRASVTYDNVSTLQQLTGDILILSLKNLLSTSGHLSDVQLNSDARFLDLGSGTGHFTSKLLTFNLNAQIISLDLAYPMLKYAKTNICEFNIREKIPIQNRLNFKFINADAEFLPLAKESVDFVFSNLMLQWIPNCNKVFLELYRIIKPNGILAFSTLGPRTLHELKTAWRAVDNAPHVNTFLDCDELLATLKAENFSIVYFKTELIQRYFNNALDLMKALKKLGARNLDIDRQQGLFTQKKLQRVIQAYEQFRNSKQLLPATYEVYFIIAIRD